MAKKDLSKMTEAELRTELEAERTKSEALQKENERRDDERRENERRARADAEAARDQAPTEEQWLKLEGEYGMTRDEIQKQWKLLSRATAPLQAELNTYRAKDAATEAVRLAKEGLKVDDPQFPKYERFVDEYLSDIPLSEKADPERLKRHMEKATHFARGKARSTDKEFRDDPESTRDSGVTAEERENAAQHFGEFAIAGMPLTITNEKLVPDDFRKRHAHPDQKEGVRMNERARWNDGVPKKPR